MRLLLGVHDWLRMHLFFPQKRSLMEENQKPLSNC